MDHRQLQLFRAVADRLNLSQAAEAMNITQPGFGYAGPIFLNIYLDTIYNTFVFAFE